MAIVTLPHNFCPYKGLQPYTEADQLYFVGRERDQEIVASNLYAAPLTILYGASGVGKTSVLMAGVLPQLRRTPRLAIVVFRAWQDAHLAMLKSQLIEETLRIIDRPIDVDATLPLDELALQCAKAVRGNIFFIFDQFEEYFLYHPPSFTSEGFDAEFARAVNRREVNANFLLCMREDSLSKLDRFKGRIPNLLGNMVRLDHLDRDAAEAAIREPLKEYNRHLLPEQIEVTIDDELVQTVIQQVRTGEVTLGQGGVGRYVGGASAIPESSSEIRIETSYLQLVMTRLWNEERRSKSNILRFSTLKHLGDADQIVRTHLDTTMAQFPNSERLVAARVFRFLVTPSGSKIAYAPADLGTYAEASTAKLLPVLRKLASQDIRVLRALPSKTGQEPRYEIFHDMLAPAVLDWRERYLQRRRTRQLQIGGSILIILTLISLAWLILLWFSYSSLEQTTASLSNVVLTSVPSTSISGSATQEPTIAAARETAAAFATNVAQVPPQATGTLLPTPSQRPTSLLPPPSVPQSTPLQPPTKPLPRETTSLGGYRILFVSDREGGFYLYLLDLVDRSVKRVSQDLDQKLNFEPSYSPVQGRIVFMRKLPLRGGGEEWNLFTTSLDGQNLSQLTKGNYNNWSPAWSPNGKLIAFTSSRNGDNGELYLMNSDGSNQHRLTSNPATDDWVTWGPDNRTIVFASNRDKNYHLYRMDVELGETSLKQLTTGAGVDFQPNWSPDGRFIVFRRAQQDTNGDNQIDQLDLGNIWIMNSDGSGQRSLTSLAYVENQPVWSPDGQWIAFGRWFAGKGEIFGMSADGQNQLNLTNDAANDFDPIWVTR